MKRLVMLALCLMILASGAFALDKAVGGGIMYNNTTTIGSSSNSYGDGYGNSYNITIDWTMARNGFGAFAFFGLSQFWELNLGLLVKNPSELQMETSAGGSTYKDKITGSDLDDVMPDCAALQLGVYFKYPIPISDTLVFFPTGGLDLELTLNNDKDDLYGFQWWHDIWIRAGVGLDFFFNEKMFLRSHLIYGAAIPVGGDSDMGLKSGHGLLIKVGLGWML